MEKKFYTCKNDVAFKEIFFNEKNKDILKCLLESILKIKINELKYLNVEKINGNIYIRRKHFDFHVKTDKENIHIEVNGEIKDYTRPRNMAYLCNTYSRDVLNGEDYDEDTLYVQINFTYNLPKKEKPLRIYRIQDDDKKTYIKNFYIYEFNMEYFVNLWYSKNKQEIKDNIYLMMMDLDLEKLKVLSNEDKVVKKYMEELERINEDPEIYEYMSAEEDNRKIMNSLKKQYMREGLEEGRAKGIKEGKKEGIKEGIKEGERCKNLENAKKMLEENIDKEIISRVTNLNMSEIDELEM